MNAPRPQVSIIAEGQFVGTSYHHHGTIVVLERKNGSGRLMLESGLVAAFTRDTIVNVIDSGSDKPWFDAYDEGIAHGVSEGAFMVALLAVEKDGRLVVRKMTTLTEYRRGKMLISARPLLEKFQPAERPHVAPKPKGLRPSDLTCLAIVRQTIRDAREALGHQK